MKTRHFDVIVVGEGAAGLTAAQHLADAGCQAATIEHGLAGGMIVNVARLDPAPTAEKISGADWSASVAMANLDRGIESVPDQVTAIRGAIGQFTVETAAGQALLARHVVIASGARFRPLGVPGESAFEGRGVSHCADCDGPLFRGSTVAVIGGGESAFQQALTLGELGAQVQLIHRSGSFRARAQSVQQASAHPNITLRTHTTVERIEGTVAVEAIWVRSAPECSTRIACAGVFPFIGLVAATEYVPTQVARDADGFLRTGASLETSVPGVWAVGAARARFPGTIEDAMADGRVVAAGIAAQLQIEAART